MKRELHVILALKSSAHSKVRKTSNFGSRSRISPDDNHSDNPNSTTHSQIAENSKWLLPRQVQLPEQQLLNSTKNEVAHASSLRGEVCPFRPAPPWDKRDWPRPPTNLRRRCDAFQQQQILRVLSPRKGRLLMRHSYDQVPRARPAPSRPRLLRSPR